MKYLGEKIDNKDIATKEDLGGGGGTPSTQDIITVRTTLAQNADSVTDIIVGWNVVQDKDASFTHDTVTNNGRITVVDTGTYCLIGAINYTGTTANYRFSSEVSIRINGTTVLDRKFKGSYIRATSGADDTSVAFCTAVKLNAGDYVEILSKRINTTTGNATITTGSNLSMINLTGEKGAEGAQGPVGGTVATNNFTLYFEEGADLNTATNSGYQWSIGNGATNSDGFLMDHSGTIRTLSLITNTATTGTVELYKNGAATGETVVLTAGTKQVTTITPIAFVSGDSFTGRTISGSGGGFCSFGIGIASDGSKGDTGEKGENGADGAPGVGAEVVVKNVTLPYTVLIGDSAKLLNCDTASSGVLTFPTGLGTPFSVGVRSANATTDIVITPNGTTITAPTGLTTTMETGTGNTCAVYALATNDFAVSGDLKTV